MLRIRSEDYINAVKNHSDNENVILKFLSDLRVFRNIPLIDLKLLSNTVTQEHFTLNQSIYRPGDIPKGLYIVYEGRIRINYPTRIPRFNHIKQKVYYTESMKDLYLSKGSYFGQRILLGKKTPCSFNIVSESALTTLLLITHHVFFLLDNPHRDEALQYIIEGSEFDVKLDFPLK